MEERYQAVLAVVQDGWRVVGSPGASRQTGRTRPRNPTANPLPVWRPQRAT